MLRCLYGGTPIKVTPAETSGHHRPGSDNAISPKDDILQYAGSRTDDASFPRDNRTRDAAPGHNGTKISNVHIVSDGGGQVNQYKITGLNTRRQDHARGQDGPSSKDVIFFIPGQASGWMRTGNSMLVLTMSRTSCFLGQRSEMASPNSLENAQR